MTTIVQQDARDKVVSSTTDVGLWSDLGDYVGHNIQKEATSDVEDGSRDGRGGAGIQERRQGGAGVQEGGDGRGKEDDFMEEQEMSWRR